MKGTEVPQDELDNAERFLELTQSPLPERMNIARADFVRILAWYGATRATKKSHTRMVVNQKPPLGSMRILALGEEVPALANALVDELGLLISPETDPADRVHGLVAEYLADEPEDV